MKLISPMAVPEAAKQLADYADEIKRLTTALEKANSRNRYLVEVLDASVTNAANFARIAKHANKVSP